MKGYRFYEELTDKNRKAEKSKGTVIALILHEETGNPIYVPGSVNTRYGTPSLIAEAICSLFDEPNSSVCSSQVAIEYLWQECRRISEDKARSIHPKLFQYLEA